MRHKILTLMLLLLATSYAAKANPVDLQTARQAGATFLNANARTPLRGADDLQLVTTYNTSRGDAAFYVFGAPNGFVIVAADDCVTPILGYSDEGRPFDPNNVPIQVQEFLQAFVEQIGYGIENDLDADESTAQRWAMVMQEGRLNNNRTTTVVEPLLTTTWDQGCYYNALCPEDGNSTYCGHALTGCVATAMGQILNFWGYPYKGHGTHTYKPSRYPEQTVDFGATAYDWANMPDELTANSTQAQINAVATLLYHCGVAVDMNYGPTSSGAYDNRVVSAFTEYFNISDDIHWGSTSIDSIKACLDRGRPIYYKGVTPPSPMGGVQTGHAWVCDGYDANNLMHFNWGWGGTYNGYYDTPYPPGGHHYTYNQGVIVDIHPKCDPESMYQVTAVKAPMDGGTVVGAGNYYCSDVCTLTASPNANYGFLYWTENDSIISYHNSISISVFEARTFTAHFGIRFTAEADPETHGRVNVEGAYPVPDLMAAYTRISDLGELKPGDRIILAARYNGTENDYVAIKNTFTGNGLPSTQFTSVTDGSNETLATSIADAVIDYFWTVGITEEGYYTFTNALGQTLGRNSWDIVLNGSESTWELSYGTSGNEAMVPNYSGFSISATSQDKGLCINEIPECHYRTMNYNSPDYNFFFDIFRQPRVAFAALSGSTITLQAVPYENYSILNWTKNGTIVGDEASYSFTITENTNYVAHFTTCPVLTIAVDPDGYGMTRIEGATPIPNEDAAYTRITNLDELKPGDRIILAARYNGTENNYVAIKNTSSWSALPTTQFTSTVSGGVETLDTSITDNVNLYYWTVGLTEEGYYTFTNANGQFLGWYANMNSSDYTWIIGQGTSGSGAMVPNYQGFTISRSSGNRGLALTSNMSCSDNYWNYNSSEYNFFLDIFRQPIEGFRADHHATVTLTAFPNEGKSFFNWTKNGAVVSTENPYSFTATESANYVAHFIDYPVVTATVNPEGSGCIASRITDVSELQAGDRIILVARYDTIATHYAAAKNTTVNSILPITFFEMDADMIQLPPSVVSHQNDYYWTIGTTESGYFTLTNANGETIGSDFAMNNADTTWNITHGTAGPSAMVPYCSGFSITNASNSSYGFCIFNYNGYEVQYTYANSNYDNRTIYFEIFRISSPWVSSYPYNSTVTLAAMPNEGYTFSNWTTDGTVVSTANPYSFTITEDVSLEANFITNPIITVSVVPDGSGTISFEGLEPAHDDAFQYSRITDLDELLPGDRIIIAARYDDVANHYVALKNGLVEDYYGNMLSTTEFTSLTESGNEILPDELETNEETYYWTVSITEDGKYIFANAAGETIQYQRSTNFGSGTNSNKWTLAKGLSDFDAMVPEYEGFTLIDASNTRGFAINTDHSCGCYSTSYMTGFNAPNYNYYFDIFRVTSNHYTGNYGASVSMTASPTANHSFFNWTKDGQVVSTEATYAFTLTENADYAAHFIANPTITVTVNPEGAGTFHIDSFEDLMPTENLGRYVRISDPSLLSDGDRIIFAARYNSNATYYVALNNTINVDGFITSTNFNKTMDGNTEILPSTIVDNESSYLWTVHISNGNCIFTNTAGDTLSYNNYMYFNMNGDKTTWTIAYGTSNASALVPNYPGFTITNATTTNRAFAIGTDRKCGAYHTSYMTDSNASSYNFYLDIFQWQNIEMTSYTGIAGYGSSITMTATSNEGYYFSNWTRNGTVVSEQATATLTIEAGDAAYVANFGDNHVTISTSAEPEGYGTASGGGVFIIGDVCTLTATPNTAYQFVNWTKNGTVVSTDAVYSFTVTETALYVAHFTTYPVTITVTASPSNGGTVTGGGTYYTHSTCTLTAIPNSGYFFSGWTKDGIGVSGSADYSFTVLEGGDYVAHFDIYTPSDLLYSINSDGQTATVTGHADGTSATGSLVIPETVMLEYWNGEAYAMGSFTVTRIAASAFKDCSGLTGSLILPSTITFIGERAFMNCTGFFGALYLGESMTTIEERAFWGCSGFVGTLVIGASVENIGDYAFKGCSGITTLDYNATNCSIGTHWNYTGTGGSSWDSSWLDECSSLTTLHIGNTVEVIPPYAFNRRIETGWPIHHALSGQLVIPNSVTTIGDGAFSRCLFTGDLVIPNSVTTIGYKAFQYSSFTGNLTLSNSLTTIGDRAFYNCDDFTGHLVIPDSVTSIGEMAFESCSGFTGVTLGNALTTIGRRAFLWCSGFTGSLTIPESVTTIGENAFASCPGFTGTLTIGNSVTTIGNNAFYGCSGFTGTLTIGNSVTTIGSGAFSGCSGFTGTLTIGNSVTTIGSSAFKNCSGFTDDLIIPNSVTSIGGGNPYYGAFQGCSGFSGILVIGSSVTSIATAAFNGCSGFTAIYVRPETPPYIYSTFEYSVESKPLYVPCGKLSDYQNNSGWSVFTNMIENCTDPVAITATCDPAEGGTLSGTGFYVEGYDCTLTATPNTGYAFSHWTKDGTVVSENATYTFTVTEAAEFVAHFVVSYDITVACNPAEGGMATGAGTYGYGTTVTLTATANENYSFINWTKNGVEVSTNEAYTFTVTENAAFTANFGFVGYEVTATANPAEGGTVSGGGSFLPNATCTLSATANEGYSFLNWTKDGTVVSEDESYTFTVTESVAFVAHFIELYQITAIASPIEGGTVIGSGEYVNGTTCTLTATPNQGYSFLNWTKDGTVVSEDESYTFTVIEPAVFVAHFIELYQITATASPIEGGIVIGSGEYVVGTTCTLTATPNQGYFFLNWTKDGSVVSENETYSFVVAENADYVANFLVSTQVTITATPNPENYGSVSGGGTYYTGSICTLIATANEGYSFGTWTKNGVVVSTNRIYSFKVLEEAEYVANFTDGITQTDDFSQGWNWWSTYVEADDLLEQLENGLGTHGVTIKSQNGYVQYMSGYNLWYGSTGFGVNNDSYYMVQTDADCEVAITGAQANPANHPITLATGWNWIGYPCTSHMSFATAFAGITPQDGDMVKSQSHGFASYMSAFNIWYGTLADYGIDPGMGLMYKSNNGETFTFTYPESRGEEPKGNDFAENSHWKANLHSYPNNMTVTAIVELDDMELSGDNYELAVFANGECRGSVRLMYVAPLNRYMAFLTVAGDEASELYFSLYDVETGTVETECLTTLQYESDATMGSFEEPYVVRFRSTTGVDELGSRINVFPNPVARGEKVNIDLKADNFGEMRVEIVNALGEVVETQGLASPQTIHAPNTTGVYTLRITVDGEGTCCRKLVVR